MSTRNASIKLSLNSGSFSSEMRRLTGQVGMVGRMMGSSLSRPLSAGFGAAKKQLAEMTSTLKGTIKQYGTLAGTIATGLLTKDAIELQGIYRTLAFDMSKLGNEAMDWKDVQMDVDKAALAAGRRAKEMAGAYGDIYRATGDVEYSRSVLEAVGTTATASGEEVNNFATAAQMMMRKFNLTAEQVPDALAAIAQQTNSGAIGLDGLNARFGMLAGEAKMAGMTGVSGMTDLLGLFRLLDSEMGEKLTPALTTMFQYLKAGTTYAKEFKKAGVNIEPDMKFVDKFKQMLKGKGRIIAEEKFTGFARNAFDLLAKPFDEAMKEAESKGMKKAEQVDYAMKQLDKAFAAASDTTWKYSDIQRMAARRMSEDPSVKLRIAIGKLESAFSQPKMISAIEKLASKLPVLADKMADFIDWIADNPWKAAGIAAGAKVGVPAASAAAGAFIPTLLKSVGTKIAAGGAAAAGGIAALSKGALATIASSGAVAEGTAAAAAMEAAASGGAITTTAGGLGLATVAGGAAVVGLAAGAGYGGYKVGAEPAMDWTNQLKKLDSIISEATRTLADRKSKAEDLNTVISKIQNAEKEFKPGIFVDAMSKITTMLGGEDSAARMHESRIKKLTQAETDLINALRRLNDGAGKAAGAMKRVGDAASSIPGREASGTTRGARKPANKHPGSVAVEG